MQHTIYLEPTEFFDYNDPGISETANELGKKHRSKVDLAVELFYFVRDYYDYSANEFSLNKDYLTAAYVFNRKSAWCLQKSVLLTALGRVCGIPSRMLIATIRNYKASNTLVENFGGNVYFPHAYTQFFLDGRWVKAAAVFDKDTCRRIGMPTVEFDGVNDAMLPDLDLGGEPFIEYLKDYGYFHDLPWDMIYQEFKQMYPDVECM
jgi:transglutaminase-like putative cysteine protease